jgi:23S rRNA pseudouridine1911/1915/1917 synthase
MSAHPLPPPTVDAPLLAWLLDALRPMSRTAVKELLRDGRIVVNGSPVTRHDHPLRPGDRVAVSRERAGPAVGTRGGAGIVTVYADDALIAIDKPAGLLSVATEGEREDTAFARVAASLAARRAGRPFVVHRIDRDTSGLLLFARTPEARDRLQADWPAVTKTYLAITDGCPDPPEGVIESYLSEGRDLKVRSSPAPRAGARHAVTRYRLVGGNGVRFKLVEAGLETGRKHQIRVHLAKIGCPVAGDDMYGAKGDPAGRLALHAWRLALAHPVTGERLELESPLPEKLRRVVG